LLALVTEAVVLGVPCLVLADRATRGWFARLTDPRADLRLGAGEWLALAAGGLTFPGLGMLTLWRLLRTGPRSWGPRQLTLLWVCAGVAAFGLVFFAAVFSLAFRGPVRALGVANLVAGLVGVPLAAVALTLAHRLGRRPAA
ncbi:MAG TPA: hypothetical protein VEW03_03240, partial [Longimicrobiaceae bacterium]|nr:hypothetical protein [Longimicrobiaceae bacterium]